MAWYDAFTSWWKDIPSEKVRVYLMYGLGGHATSHGTENYVGAGLAKIPGVEVAHTVTRTQYRIIADAIKRDRNRNPNIKIVVVGHSMGAVAATYVTDHVKVDLLVLYDMAGGAPSPLGSNTKACLDFYDVAFDLVPEWRPRSIPGRGPKIEQHIGRMGHGSAPYNPEWFKILEKKVRELAK